MGRLTGILRRHPAARWAAPAAAVAVVAAVGVVAADSASADDHPVLSPLSAQQLLTDALTPGTQTLSGTVATSADLGLPDLSGLGAAVTGTGVVPGSAASIAPGTSSGTTSSAASTTALDDLTGLLTGSHTLRVWADGPTRSRVAVVGDGEESDVVRDGTDVWVWRSAGNQALHATLPSSASSSPLAVPTPGAGTSAPTLPPDLLAQLPTTPQQAASLVLRAVGPTTDVGTESTASVAGRPAYRLVATPKQAGSLVSRVVVAIDATTHVPLRVDVYSTQRTDPAFSVGFTSVDFAAPPAGVFAFTPPAGATVTQVPDERTAPTTGPEASGTRPQVRTVGNGWATVLVVTPATGSSSGGSSGGTATDEPTLPSALAAALPTVSGSWGSGHALSGTLISALVTDSGTLAVGAVPVATLEAALAAGPTR